jgi:DNA helicase-2/ATP-dependent DNA helicase PcrA
MSWDDGLEGQAREIASTNDSPVRVQAGPGSGKTFSLVRRIMRLLEDGIDPERILLVTFTRVSALDLASELEDLDHPEASRIRKGTLHSLCFSILSRARVFEHTGRVARPLMEFESRFLLEDLGQHENLGNFNDRKNRLRAFEAAWATLQDQDPGWPSDELDTQYQARLIEWLGFHKAMLLGELVPLTLNYLRINPQAPELGMFDHVLVDEYQDLNRAEQELIDLLGDRASLTIVGDEDQSVYESFRFAHPEGIGEFHETHEGTVDLPLEVSRRCPTLIVEMANSLISNNQRRTPRRLDPIEGAPEGDVHVVQWWTLEEEAEGIADFISQKVESDEFDLGRTLVLTPRRQIGYMIRDELRERGHVAYSYFHEEALDGNPKELDASLAQQSFTLLRLLVDPNDRVSLRCWLGFGSSSLRSASYLRLWHNCANTGREPREVLDVLISGDESIPHTSYLFDRYRLLLEQLEYLSSLPDEDILEALFPVAEPWTGAFWQIFTDNPEASTPKEIYETLQINLTQPEMPRDVDFMRVMSLHKSKGLNADHVIIAGCIEGLLPYREDGLPENLHQRRIEEQRRLFYVAITRARQTLVLSSVRYLPRDLAYRMRANVIGGNRDYAETITSNFISELGETCPDPVSGKDWEY